jgi:hypothetical protein
MLLVFPCVPERRIPYLLLHSPYLFCLCLCLEVWQTDGIGGGQSKNTSLECMLKTLKGDLMEITPGKLRTFCEID